MRLIDADELIIALHDEGEKQTKWGQLIMLLYSTMVAVINDAPTIDPVRHGYWKETDDPMFRACSVCGYLEYGGLWNNYCPECGARMDGGTVDETD